jgi:hypothetical protein
VSAYWRSICRRDSVWIRFCAQRWKLETPREILKACATEDYVELYSYLDRNGLVPRGKFTSKVRSPRSFLDWYSRANLSI